MQPTSRDNEFEAAVETWQQLRRDQDRSAATFYTHHVLPGVFARFRPTITADYQAMYRGLILVGSGQPDTAALLIAGLNPERIAFLLTQATSTFRQRVYAALGVLGVREALRCPFEDWLPLDTSGNTSIHDGEYSDLHNDHSSVLNTYRGLQLVLHEWKDLPRAAVAIDLTGGKSTMTVGLAKSAHVLGIQNVYVDSDYDDKNQIVQGTQRFALTEDPYTVFGHLEADEAKRLYRSHDYNGATRIFAKLARRVDKADGVRYGAFATLATMYAAWDALDFVAATHEAEALLEMPLSEIRELAAHTAQLTNQAKTLGELVKVSASVSGTSNETKLQTLADPGAMLPLLGTLHAAALRRSEHPLQEEAPEEQNAWHAGEPRRAADGRYDFAALFRYRCLELISQHRLAVHGIFTGNPDFRHFADNGVALSESFKQVQTLIGRKEIRGLKKLRNVALFDGYMLLAALDDPLVHDYPIKRIEDRSKARNQSVLAHGYRLIDKSEYDEFAEVVEEILSRLFANVLNYDRDEWVQQYRFVQPFG